MSSRLTIFVKSLRSEVIKKKIILQEKKRRNSNVKSFEVRVHMKNGTHFNNAVKKISNTENIRSNTKKHQVPNISKKYQIHIQYLDEKSCGENNSYHTLTQIISQIPIMFDENCVGHSSKTEINSI